MATSNVDMQTGEVLDTRTASADDGSPVSDSLLERIVRSQHTHTVELKSPAEIRAAMQQLDDEQLAEMAEGQWSEKWFYRFRSGNKDVIGISAIGARELRRLRASEGFPIGIRPQDVVITEAVEDGQRGIRVVASGRCVRSGNEAIAATFYPHWALMEGQQPPDGKRYFDAKAGRKALGAAERNIIVALVPRALAMRLLAGAQERASRNGPVVLKAASRELSRRQTQPSAPVAPDPYGPPGAEGAPVAGKPANPSPDAAPPCPKCGGAMWDERPTKRNPKAPDFKCKDKQNCDGVIWPPKEPKDGAKGGGELPLNDARPAAPARGPRNAISEP